MKITLAGLPPPAITVETRYNEEKDLTDEIIDVTLYPDEHL